MSHLIHIPNSDPAPWSDDLTPMIRVGDFRVRINGKLPKVAMRLLAEENFQLGKVAVNNFDKMLDALWDIANNYEGSMVMQRRARAVIKGVEADCKTVLEGLKNVSQK